MTLQQLIQWTFIAFPALLGLIGIYVIIKAFVDFERSVRHAREVERRIRRMKDKRGGVR